MAEGNVSSTQCEVEFLMPDGVKLLLTSNDAAQDLLQVHTSNDLAEACGTFSLTLAPRVINGRTYDQLIPLRSLVTIRMQDPASPVSEAESVVMIGLTEDQGIGEDYGQAAPRRVVTIHGRSIAAVMLDHVLFYHPGLENQPATGVLQDQASIAGDMRLFWDSKLVENQEDPRRALAIILQYFLGLKGQGMESLQDQLAMQQATQAVQAEQPGLPPAQVQSEARKSLGRTRGDLRPPVPPPPADVPLVGDQPLSAAALDAIILQDTLRQTQSANPKIAERARRLLAKQGKTVPAAPTKTQSPSALPPSPDQQATAKVRPPVTPDTHQIINLQLPGRSLADLLDMNNETWRLFEDGITVPLGQNTAFAGSLWNYLHIFVDGLFQEFFTRIEGGVCKIHFRPKPFLQTPVTQGSRFREDLPTCPTLQFQDAIIVQSQLRRQIASVYNFFRVLPLGASTSLKDPSFLYRIAPTVVTDLQRPSPVQRYGIRLLHHASPYLNGRPTVPGTPPNETDEYVVDAANRWGKIAGAFYDSAPELYAGFLTVPGSPRWNMGMRGLTRDSRGDREFYIEGIEHIYDYRQGGQYLSRLRVTRLWYLDGATDQREGISGTSESLS